MGQWLPGAEGLGEQEGTANGSQGSFWGAMKMFRRKMEVAPYCEDTKCHCIVHFKTVDFTLCEFYFSKKNNLSCRAQRDLRVGGQGLGFKGD